ncbi:hypothetical protein ACIRD6_23185 [Streptomyces sp. NPDC102473]|uniref:hypothetical protein n=1 Tax=Streptomyces sp. NPDC102473 TaxID=3366180 RepID=UPI00380BAFEF
MGITVNLPQEDIDFLDAYATAACLPSRSAVLHVAVALLRKAEQEADREAR